MNAVSRSSASGLRAEAPKRLFIQVAYGKPFLDANRRNLQRGTSAD